jgi:adenosylcobinamide-phosphate synthase
MSFVAALIALLLDQVRPPAHAHLAERAAQVWVRAMLHWGDTGQPAHARWLAGFAIVLPVAAAWAVEFALSRLNPVLSWLWTVAVLYVCLGFRQFSSGFGAVRAALEVKDIDAARAAFERWTQIKPGLMSQQQLTESAASYGIVQTHRHVLAPLFAFICLPSVAGPVLYRVAELCASPRASASPAFTNACSTVLSIMELVATRISAAGFAIVGHFEEAASAWRNWNITGGGGSPMRWLLAVAYGALVVRTEATTQESAVEQITAPGFSPEQLSQVVGLLWRSVVMWMVLFALLQFSALVPRVT